MAVPDYHPIPISPAAHYLASIQALPSDHPDQPATLDEQVNFAYQLLCAGNRAIQVIQKITAQFGQGAKPRLALEKARLLIQEEDRQELPFKGAMISALRREAIRVGLYNGQIGAVAGLLRDEAADLAASRAVPAGAQTLSVEILPPGSLY